MTTPISPQAAKERNRTIQTQPVRLSAFSRIKQARDSLAEILRHPETMELFILLVVLSLLSMLFFQLRDLANSGDGRYAQLHLQPVQLPHKVLQGICNRHGALAATEVAAVCDKAWPLGSEEPGNRLPVSLEKVLREIPESFAAPLRPVYVEIQRLTLRQREGLADTDEKDAPDERIAVLRAEIMPYETAYRLEADPLKAGPSPFQCLNAVAEPAWQMAATPQTRANLALWLAARLDGRQTAVGLDDDTYLALNNAWQKKTTPRFCADFAGAQEAAAATAALLGKARDRAAETHKAEGMRQLLKNAWWQWPLWCLLTFLFVGAARKGVLLWPATGQVLLVWGLLGWLCQVWLPFGDELNAEWSQPQHLPVPLPPWPISVMALCGVVLWLGGLVWSRFWKPQSLAREESSSRFAFVGLVICAGLGWLVLLDLSATGHPKNQFLALRQQGYLWGALALLCLVSLWRQRIARWLARWLAFFENVGGKLAPRIAWGRWLGPVLLGILIVVLFALLRGNRQVTSEIGRLWLITGVAWFYFTRGDLAFRFASQGGHLGLIKFLSPLIMVVSVLFLSMLATDDMGPLLISAYGAGIFVAAAVHYGLLRQGWSPAKSSFSSVLLLVAWMVGLTEVLFYIGHFHVTTASRLESVIIPLIATNDQIGIISLFRQATPLWGYGIGQVPWCGYAAAGNCRGVPLQIHSDYTFTAFWGVFGQAFTSFFVFISLFWLYHLVKRHSNVTTGLAAKRANSTGGMGIADHQGLLSWLCVSWLILTVCQLVVTVAGNLRVLPLTGVTYPFVSFGMTSLWVNTFFLGLCLNVTAPEKKIND